MAKEQENEDRNRDNMEDGIGEGALSVVTQRDKRGSGKVVELVPGYVPTQNEQRLLDIMLDPFHRMSSVTRQCELAGVSRMAYYRALQNPDFMRYYRDALYDLIKANAGQLINIGIREARKGSFPHWKVLLEMGGLHNDKKVVEHEGEQTMKVVFVDPDSDE